MLTSNCHDNVLSFSVLISFFRIVVRHHFFFFFFFFNDTATTEIYPLPLYDALPIYPAEPQLLKPAQQRALDHPARDALRLDRKSTRLNSSHSQISYAVFCLKKKKKKQFSLIGHIPFLQAIPPPAQHLTTSRPLLHPH